MREKRNMLHFHINEVTEKSAEKINDSNLVTLTHTWNSDLYPDASVSRISGR
jgi:hypothetical protein